MRIIKLLLPLYFVLFGSGCASFGPTVVIDTPEPAEDIVVLCMKSKSYFIGHNASGYTMADKVFVAKSGEEVDCGLLLGGKAAGVSVMHPIYVGDGKQNYTKDGVEHIVYNKTKLDVLDELKARFEAGEWDNSLNPGAEYSRNMVGCGFPKQYFDYYSEVNKVDRDHFRNLYHNSMLECFRRSFSVTKKYDPQIGKQLPSPEEWMDRLWNSEEWSKWNESK